MTPTFLLGPRRGHDEGHYQVQRSQEAGGRAPRAPAAAGRGLQTGPGGRESGGGSCCSSGPLPHPCRPGAAALQVWRGPSRRGGGAGAVVRARAAALGTRAAPGPGLGLRAWVWVRVCVWARVSVTAAASASPARSRSGEAASQPRRAAILETGRDHGLRALASEGRGAALGTAHAAPSPGGPPASCPPRTPRAGTARPTLGGPQLQRPGGAGTAQPQPVTLPAGRRKEAAPAARTCDGSARFAEAVTAITWRREASRRSRRGVGAGRRGGPAAALTRAAAPASLALQRWSLPEG